MAEPPAWDAVFVDRDGTLNVPARGRYVRDPAELQLLPGAAEAVRLLNEAAVPVFVVTNQQGIATGDLDLVGLDAIHRRLAELLAAEGAELDGVYVCPHREGTCTCRKPADGLIRRALVDRPDLVPGRCAIVGDSRTDVQAGTTLGLTRVLLGKTSAGDVESTAADLLAAARWLLIHPPRA